MQQWRDGYRITARYKASSLQQYCHKELQLGSSRGLRSTFANFQGKKQVFLGKC